MDSPRGFKEPSGFKGRLKEKGTGKKGEGGKEKEQANPVMDPDWSVITPTEDWKTVTLSLQNPAEFKVDPNFYVEVSQVGVGAQ